MALSVDMNLKFVLLREVQFAVSKAMSRRELTTMRHEVVQHAAYDLGESLVFTLHAYLYGQDVGQTTVNLEVSYPADWWEAFKDRWFPAWAKRHWPTKLHHETRSQTVGLTDIYPQSRVAIPTQQYGQPVSVLVQEGWPGKQP